MPRVNFFDSEECAWSDMVVQIGGAPITKIRGIQYGVDSDDEELFAAGDEAISIQSGNIKKEGSMKILKGALDDLQAAAILAGGRFVTDIKFDVVITYLPAIGRDPVIDVLAGVKINKMPRGWNQGDKFMDCELPFKFLRLNP